MRYGFIIDNRKCIGCHACTVACKAEHDVPVGVNRTWVKQVEKGTFPNTRRVFSVMRCNHCTDAPCVEICPVEALFYREDGIVDFDNRRCIGCKSCMQACPYDALYINPENNTAAKCNYCAHRIDIGLEPACVNVCPEHAIISGDMDDPDTEIAQLLSREQVTARKTAKGTSPNLFYINGDEASLNPVATPKDGNYFWNSQTRGVGHFAKAAEKYAYSNEDVVQTLLQATERNLESADRPVKSIDLLMGDKKPRRIYDAPDKGILWGWEVPAYVLTKAISSGSFMVYFTGMILGWGNDHPAMTWGSLVTALVFLGLTGLFLVMDLDRPDRFLNVLLRPQWGSWLVRGGYTITVFGGLVTAYAVLQWFGLSGIGEMVGWLTLAVSVIVSVYTAFLFAQAKGRDFWQSPAMAFHMLGHSVLAGGAALILLAALFGQLDEWSGFLSMALMIFIPVNLAILAVELLTTHPTQEAKNTVKMIISGRYKTKFWMGVILFGNLLPLALLFFGGAMGALVLPLVAIIVLTGILFNEQIWVEAPQRIPLS